ncbi:MAG TPA: MFS transporter [Verrucomicrobiales bacterium]|nr:MFS transporter [Verrucomicrobiales bacterium]
MKDIFAAFRRLPAPFWVLAGGTFVNRFATFLIPFLTLYMTRNHYTTWEIAMALTAYAVGGFLCSFVAGLLADRFGRNRVMSISLFLEACCVLGMGFADTFVSIATLAGLAGFVAQGAQPATQALIADLVPDGDRVAAQLAIRVAINGGWALGPAVAGFVVVSHSYLWLFVADAISSACFAVLAWFFLPKGKPAGRSGGRWGPALKALRACPPMVGILVATLCASFVFRQLCITLSLYFTDNGHTEADYGIAQSLNGIMIIVFEIPLTAMTAWLTYRAGVAWGFLLLGLGMAVNMLGASLLILNAGMALFTLGEMLCLPRHAAWVQQLAPVDMRGRFSGFVAFSWLGGNLLGTWAGLELYRFSPQFLWGLCGLVGVISAVVLLCLRPYQAAAPDDSQPECA